MRSLVVTINSPWGPIVESRRIWFVTLVKKVRDPSGRWRIPNLGVPNDTLRHGSRRQTPTVRPVGRIMVYSRVTLHGLWCFEEVLIEDKDDLHPCLVGVSFFYVTYSTNTRKCWELNLRQRQWISHSWSCSQTEPDWSKIWFLGCRVLRSVRTR